VGCRGSLDPSDPIHVCLFSRSGFTINGLHLRGCQVQYHAACIAVGPPFRSRLDRLGKGLVYPPTMTLFPFICESCTVRGVLGREIGPTWQDRQLLCLERMRMIDAAHAWAPSSMAGVHLRLRNLAAFGVKFGFQICQPPVIPAPPCSPIIPILWAISHYTLQVSRSSLRSHGEDHHITYNTARGLQSAASAFFAWTRMLAYPSIVFQSPERRLLGNPWLSPTDSLLATLTHRGMKKRLGISTTPAIALHHRHVAWNQAHRDQLFRGTQDPYLRYLLAAANLVVVIGWGGWLRASEVFSLNHGDVSRCAPDEGSRFGLPLGVGALFLRLLPMTKSSPYGPRLHLCIWFVSR